MQVPRDQLLAELARLDQRYTELEHQVAAQAGDSRSDPHAFQQLAKELSDLRDTVMTYRTYVRLEREVAEADALFHAQGDLEVREMAKEEAVALRAQQIDLLTELERDWLERHASPEHPLIVEIRAGTGGLEASLFVADLYRI